MNEHRIRCLGEAKQLALGAQLARSLRWPALILLQGDLGAGKTTLVRGLLRALGHAGAVKSPTYTLLESYDTAAGPVQHLDLYRIGDAEELEYLGLREMLGEAVVLIEWPERGAGWLPPPDLVLQLSRIDDGRDIHMMARSPRGEEILAALWAEDHTADS
jgi:tRNA threonylcarbamoyladenosine biosynthesis protein TsaE